jgi:hypothetical protein
MMKRIAVFSYTIMALICLACLLPSCSNQNGVSHEVDKVQPTKQATFQIKLVEYDNGWGYDIYLEEKLVIHQPHIPAIAGRKGFKTKEQANSVAELAVLKIKNGIMPPTITHHELDSLGIIEN